MANTYRKIGLQFAFAVKHRQTLLDKSWRPQFFKYITGIINQREHFSNTVNRYTDHIHTLFDYKRYEFFSDLIREVKKVSNAYINNRNLSQIKFEWQLGYDVFSCGYQEKDMVINYIKKQEEHHSKNLLKRIFTIIKTS